MPVQSAAAMLVTPCKPDSPINPLEICKSRSKALLPGVSPYPEDPSPSLLGIKWSLLHRSSSANCCRGKQWKVPLLSLYMNKFFFPKLAEEKHAKYFFPPLQGSLWLPSLHTVSMCCSQLQVVATASCRMLRAALPASLGRSSIC